MPASAAPGPWPNRSRPPPRRPTAWALLLLAVLLLHGLVLFGLAPSRTPAPGVAAPPRAAELAPPALTVRALPNGQPMVHAAVRADPAAEPAARQPAAARQRAMAAASAPLTATPNATLAATPTVSADAAPAPAAARLEARADSDAPAIPATEAPATASGPPRATVDMALPVYATRLPGSASLHYQLQRGALVGSAQLHWQRQGDAYELSLDGELQGQSVLGSVSRGVIDTDGVAPLRLAERRRAREVRAANFQRDAQRITFSGPQLEYPLLAGAQDRLSWMIQLPAIVEADPSLALSGARVTLFVVGTRGDAEAWHFEVQGRQALELPAGAVANALHLRREPRRPYDTRVEVWLDPARQHLPVRAVLTTVPGGQALEFKLVHVARAAI